MSDRTPRRPRANAEWADAPDGRRSGLDRLSSVAPRSRRDAATEQVGAGPVDTRALGSEPLDTDVAGTRPLDPTIPDGAIPDPAVPDPGTAPETPGWGIGAMPAWLDPRAAAIGGAGAPSRYGDRDPAAFRVGDLDDDRDRGYADDRYRDFGDDRDFDMDRDFDTDRDFDDDPPRRRFAMVPPAAVALIAIGVIACAVAGYGLLRNTESAPAVNFPAPAGESRPDGATAGNGTSESPGSAGRTAQQAQIVVSVVGLVYKPGLVRLAPDARVADAIHHAGGPRRGADLLSLNLAQVMRDGDQVLVGYAGEKGQALRSAVVSGGGQSEPTAGAGGPSGGASGGASSGSGSGAASGGKVNLNTASESDLDALPGVGPVTAKAILAWRTANGKFTSVDQLAEVDGIGPAKLARLRDQVTV